VAIRVTTFDPDFFYLPDCFPHHHFLPPLQTASLRLQSE
jgi:hypothetical protein